MDPQPAFLECGFLIPALDLLTLHIDHGRLAARLDKVGASATQLNPLCGTFEPVPEALRLMEAAWVAMARGGASANLAVDGLVTQLLALMLARVDRVPVPPPRLGDRRLWRVAEYVEAHLSEPVTAGELAAVACLSPMHLTRAFRAATGQIPERYVTTRRVERARGMLADSDTALAEVAFACGFGSQSHFTRVFRAHMGATPGTYRAEEVARRAANPRCTYLSTARPFRPPVAHEFRAGGLRAVALPPGPAEFAVEMVWHSLDVVPVTMTNEVLRIGGEDFGQRVIEADSLCWQPAGTDFRLRSRNVEWEVILEVDPSRCEALAHEALDGRALTGEFVFWRRDPLVAGPARLLVEHLRRPEVDPLYAESLSLAVLARGLRLAAGGMAEPSTRGTDRRIARAMAFAEARLAEPLEVAEMAAVACLSSTQFTRAFRATTGRPPHAWVTARRVERARAMLADPDMPLAEVAFACGFGSQSHFTRVFQGQTGVAPGAYRGQVTE